MKGVRDLAKLNKICRVCSPGEYAYCPSCDYQEPAYKQLVCSENCYNIWHTLSRKGVGLATTQETLEALESIPMPSTLQPSIKAHIDRLWAEMEVATAPVVEEEPVVEEVIPVVVIEDEPVVIEPIVAPRKKKNKAVEPIIETIEVVLEDEV